jgi:hypothetical protein
MIREELANRIKNMDIDGLRAHERASKLAQRLCSTIGIVSMFAAILMPSVITIIGAAISAYIFGNLAVGLDIISGEVRTALAEKINS